MLKRLLVCALVLLFTVPSLASAEPPEPERGLGIVNPEMPTAEDLIYRAYIGLIGWTVARGSYARNKDGSRMKYFRLVEILQAPVQPATITGIPFGPPKIRKIYFQVVARANKAFPESPKDIDSEVRIVVVETTRTDEFFVSRYYVGKDNNLDGLPNSVKEWTAYKSLKTKKVVKRDKVKAPDIPESAEIVDMTWGKWSAEFIKLFQLHALEDFSGWFWFDSNPELREVILEELAYDKESNCCFSFNSNLASDADLWLDGTKARQEGL